MEHTRCSMEQLFIAKEGGRSTIRCYLSDPTPLEEKTLGQLFGLFEIHSTEKTVNDEILDFIVHEFSTHYYRAETASVDVAFEEALHAVNLKIQEIISQIGEEWLAHTSILLGVRHQQHLVFSYVGNAIALMIHHEKITDLIDTTHAKTQSIQSSKVFSSTLAGELRRHAALFFATEHILDYLSREKIKRVIEHHEPQEAIEELYQLLGEDTTNTNFLALLLRLEQETKSSEFPNQTIAHEQQHQDSMMELVGKESRTEELLSASLWSGMKKWMRGQQEKTKHSSLDNGTGTKTIRPSAFDTLEEDKLPNARTRDHFSQSRLTRTSLSRPSILRSLLLVLMRGLGTGGQLLGKGFGALWHLGKNLFHRSSINSSSLMPYRRAHHSIPERLGNIATRIGRWFVSLTRIQKLFFVVGIVVLLIFAQSVVNRGEKQIRSEEEGQYGTLLTDAEKKINEGKAALLYDGARARTLFLEARGIMEQIPADSSLFRERGTPLQQTLQEQLKLVNNVVVINEPRILLNYANIHPDIHLRRMILLGASVYAFDENNLSVYRGNLENQGTTITMSDTKNSNGTFQSVAKASPGTGIVIFANENIALFNPVSETLNPLDLGYGNRDRHLVDIVVYGVRLYTLDTVQNQIFRHDRKGEVFTEGAAWLTEGAATFTDATSMAIDGNVYVLKTNGNVLKLTSGSRDNNFQLESIDPELSSAEKIATDENTKNIYILDRARERVAVFTKEGKLVNQYTSTAFTDLRDMIVDEPNKRILLLNGAVVMQIDINN